MKIGFVILCYGQYELVKRCVTHITRLKCSQNPQIVLVDNCSPDNTGELLQRDYSCTENIHVIINKSNDGFARGNNLGYKYSTNNLGCDCLVIMNSDVFIEDHDFLNKLENYINSEPRLSIIAPDVLGSNNRHCNPLAPGVIPRKAIVRNIILNVVANVLLSVHIDYRKLRKKRNQPTINQIDQYNIMPHGCCVIFCPKWIGKEDRAFYSKTFLFCEEYFLTAYAKKRRHIIAYKPGLVVRHLGDASIEETIKGPMKKQIFINKCQTKSLLKYLRFEKNVEKNWNN